MTDTVNADDLNIGKAGTNEIIEGQPGPIDGSEQRLWRFTDLIIILIGSGIAFFAIIAASLIIGSIRGRSGLLMDQPTLAFSLILGLTEAVALFVGVYIFGLRRRKYGWGAVLLNPLSNRWLIISILLGLAAIPLSSLVAILVQAVFNLPPVNPQLDFLIPDGFSWLGFIGMLLIGGLLIPFSEELLFRGIFYRFFDQKWGVWAGILISAFIFGLAHGEIAVSTAAFILGILLAWLYEKSQSLWAPVMVHIINNAVKIALIYILAAAGIDISGI